MSVLPFFKKILTNHFFVTFKCRNAKDGDDDHRRREMEDGKMDNMGKDMMG